MEKETQQGQKCPCGFWGSPATNNLCSKCFKEQLNKHYLEEPPVVSNSKPVVQAAATPSPKIDPPKKKRRCGSCNKKMSPSESSVGYCKCEKTFCLLHRLPEQHNCLYDHKADGRKHDESKMVVHEEKHGRSYERL